MAVVSRDPKIRLAAARAFDHAPPSWDVHLYEAAPRRADVLVYGSDFRDEAGEDIVFDPASKPDVIDAVKRSIEIARAKVFTVTGTGGGVGVTSAALHLAAGAAREHSTCHIDLNPRWSVSSRLGIETDHPTWQDARDGEESLLRSALPVAGGFRVLLAPDNEMDRDDIPGVLLAATSMFDRLIIDCGDPDLLDIALGASDAAVLITPPTVTGALRSAALIDAHEEVHWAVVVNRLGPGGDTSKAEFHRLLGRRTAIELVCSPGLRDAEDNACLVTSLWSGYVRAISRLLCALEATA